MKFKCSANDFKNAFANVSSVAAVRDIKVILQNVKMEVESDKVILLATDMDMAIRHELKNVEVEEVGSIMIPTRLIRNILQSFCDKTISFEEKDGKVIVNGERAVYQMPTQSAEDFPEISPFSDDSFHSVTGKVLCDLIRRTKFAIDMGNNRYMLGGVLFVFNEGNISTVSTDGRRMAYQIGQATSINGHHSENESIVTLKTMLLAEKSIANDDEIVKISVSNGKISFANASSVISSRLIDGRFPKWEKIIPNSDGRTRVDVIAGRLLSAVRQAEVVTNDKHPGITFNFTNGVLKLSGNGPEIGKSEVEFPISFDGEPVVLNMNPQYVNDFLKVLEDEQLVSIYLKGDNSVLFATEDDYKYVVMPLT